MLDVGRLRALLAVREHRSVSAAARAMSCPPTEVAEQLATLERQLGVTLVEGEPRAPRLTPAGTRLAAQADRVLAELERAEAEVATLAGRVAGVLTLGAPPSMGQALLGETLARLRETAPDVELRVTEFGPDEGLRHVLAGDVDAAVVGEYGLLPRRPDPALERRELAVEPMLVAVPAGYGTPGTTVRLSDLAWERWISGPTGSAERELLRRAASIAGFEPALVGRCGDGMALALVGAGHGVALVSASAALRPGRGGESAVPGVRLLTPVDPTLRRTLTAVARVSRAGDPAVVRLLDALAASGRRFVDATPGAARPAPADLASAGPADAASALSGPVGVVRPGGAGEPAGLAPDRNGRPGALPPPAASRSPLGPLPPAEPGPRAADPPNGFPLSADLGVRSLPTPDLPPPPARGGPTAPPPIAPPNMFSARERDPGERSQPPGAPPSGPPPLPRRGRIEARRPSDRPDDLSRRARAPEESERYGDASGFAGSGRLGENGRLGSPGGFGEAGRFGDTNLFGDANLFEDRRLGDNGRFDDSSRLADSVRQSDIGRFGPLGTLPPAPPDDDVRLSIFEELQSEWFSRRTPATRGAGPAPWDSPADDGWRAAARLSEPPTGGTTAAGLPRRVPQAMYVPGAVGSADQQASGAASRSARDVRGRLSSYRDGVRRGRHAERQSEEPSDR